MKKVTSSRQPVEETMRPEYDFQGGVRGKHYHALQGGYTITIHQTDGTTVVKEIKIKPVAGTVVLDPDVRTYFPDSESVNMVLRALIHLIPRGAKKERTRRQV